MEAGQTGLFASLPKREDEWVQFLPLLLLLLYRLLLFREPREFLQVTIGVRKDEERCPLSLLPYPFRL